MHTIVDLALRHKQNVFLLQFAYSALQKTLECKIKIAEYTNQLQYWPNFINMRVIMETLLKC